MRPAGGGNGNGNRGSNGQGNDAAEAYRGKLRAEDLGYSDPNYESKHNKSIISVDRHV